jgi:hypothetical protein
MKRIGLAVGLLAAGALSLSAQAPAEKAEIRPFVGAYLPTGPQRDLFKAAALFGTQVAAEIDETLHLVGTFAWSPVHNKYAGVDENVSIFSYDLGVEVGVTRPMANDWLFKPFAGLGVGGRAYEFKATTLSDRSCAAAYGSLGSELQIARMALRFEARDNVFCYKSPVAGVDAKTRNDVVLAFGVAYHFR